MERHFFTQYMTSLKHNLLYELSASEVPGYNRSKSQWNSDIYRFISGAFRLQQIPELLRGYRKQVLATPSPSLHDACIGWCLLESLGRELACANGEKKNPLEFNLSRVRHIAICVPAIRELTLKVMPLLVNEDFELSTDSLHHRFPMLAKEAERKVKQSVSRMRELRNATNSESAGMSFRELLDLVTLVRLFGELNAWGIDDYPTNGFFGLE